MHALNANVGTSSAYRVLLQTFLQIPAQAADLAIHHKVKARFPTELLKELVDAGSFSREAREIIISLRALDARVNRRQLLSVRESDRLFRVARVIALAEVAFGGRDKARRWLNAPKRRFRGNSLVGMLTTTVGAFLIEDTLLQLTEGYVL
jgi:putative toxin-antitoxin system antitoxin component (TIGR02293 family)